LDVHRWGRPFALVINYLGETLIPWHAIVGLFEVQKTNGNKCMTLQLQGLLEEIGLIHRVLAFVKDEGGNLGFMATTLQSIIDCRLLEILQVYKGTCFGHVMSKAC